MFGKSCGFRVAKESIPNKVTFEQSSKGAPVTRYIDIRRRCVLGRGNSKCKSPEVGACVICLRTNKKGQGS